MIEIYFVGVIVAFLLGCKLLYNIKNKTNIQYGILAPLSLLSWISVVLILWKLKK